MAVFRFQNPQITFDEEKEILWREQLILDSFICYDKIIISVKLLQLLRFCSKRNDKTHNIKL